MKITKKDLIKLIEQEIKIIEADEGAEMMQAMEKMPPEAQDIAQEAIDKIKGLTEPLKMEPGALAAMVGELIISGVEE